MSVKEHRRHRVIPKDELDANRLTRKGRPVVPTEEERAETERRRKQRLAAAKNRRSE